jgi:Flp pilus assembly protein TadG
MLHNEDGVVAMEAALLFPVFMILLMGTFDIGRAMVASQHTIKAAHMAADLIARQSEVNEDKVNEALTASRLTFPESQQSSVKIYVASILFQNNIAVIDWESETENAEANDNILNQVADLGENGEGVVTVTVNYRFDPLFDFGLIKPIEMQETAFTRGRRQANVEYTE